MHAPRRKKRRRRSSQIHRPGTEKPQWESAFGLQTLAAPSPNKSIGFGHAPDMMQDPGKQAAPKPKPSPSTEVPDLDEATVKAIKKAIAANDKAKALSILLKALNAKDPAFYDISILEDQKLFTKYGSTSNTAQGKNFKKWLPTALSKAPKDAKNNDGKMRTYLNTLKVPNGSLDVRVNISEKAFSSVSNLYSTVRHEYIHVNQIKAAPLLYISSSVWPRGYSNPSEKTELNKREIEAYLWEADNIKNTGLINDPQAIWNIRTQLSDEGLLGAKNIASYSARWEKALKDLWTLSATGYIQQGEATIKAAGTNPLNATQVNKLEEVKRYLDDLWAYTKVNAKDRTALKPRYQAISDALFPSILAIAKKDMGSARSGYDGYNVWNPLIKAWRGLSSGAKTKNETAYKAVMLPLFSKAFSQMETLFWKEQKANQDTNSYGLGNSMYKMIQRAGDCFITGATLKDFQERFKKVRKIVEGN